MILGQLRRNIFVQRQHVMEGLARTDSAIEKESAMRVQRGGLTLTQGVFTARGPDRIASSAEGL